MGDQPVTTIKPKPLSQDVSIALAFGLELQPPIIAPSIPPINIKAGKIRHRRHYRIVFEKPATPLHKVSNFGMAFKALEDVIEGSF